MSGGPRFQFNCTLSSITERRTIGKVNARRSPGQRAGLRAHQVRAAARELLAAEGVRALTMRALATRLGVAPNALYSHVSNKGALIDDVLDDVLADVEAPATDVDDPARGLLELLESTYHVLLLHANLVPMFLARQGARGANAQHLGNVMLALLARLGLAEAPAREALHVLVVYTIGCAAFATRPLIGADVDLEQGIHEAEVRRTFQRGLSWLLAGIAAPAA
jgi:TetR/AcrR family tetracycline transcriptional repressor